MRSICASGRFSKALVPAVAELMRTPSTSSTTWLALLPRRKMPDTWPGPPLALISTPPRVCSSSVSVIGPALAMVSASMTRRSASTVSIG